MLQYKKNFQDLKQAPQLFGMKMKLNYEARMEKID